MLRKPSISSCPSTLYSSSSNASEKPINKIYLLGSYEVGKTSILKSLAGEMFSEKYNMTFDTNILNKEVNGIGCQIFDVSSIRRFDKNLQDYIQEPSAIIFMFDNRPESLEVVIKWYELAKQQFADFDKIYKTFVANKIDLQWNKKLDDQAAIYTATNEIAYTSLTVKDSAKVIELFNKIVDSLHEFENDQFIVYQTRKRGHCVMM